MFWFLQFLSGRFISRSTIVGLFRGVSTGLLKVNLNPPGMSCVATGIRHGLVLRKLFYENVYFEAKYSWEIPTVIPKS